MVIVIFHVFYLIGKLVYRSYQEREGHSLESEKTQEQQEAEVAASEQKQNGRFESDGNGNRDSNTKSMTSELDPHDPWHPDNDESVYYSNYTKAIRPCGPIRFNPPAYIQRYMTVKDVLEDWQFQGKLRKVADLGCSELSFFRYLKNTIGVEEVLCLDNDKRVLDMNKRKVDAMIGDYLHLRSSPLRVSVYHGDINYRDNRLLNIDAAVCIELIEHLPSEEIIQFPYTIFGFMQPKVVIITTPNADFNVLFPNFKGFRHYDHKFEWSREQFQDWANNITVRYPSYGVYFQGICYGPEGTEDLGACTQMAVFYRTDFTSSASDDPSTGCQDTSPEFEVRNDLLIPVRITEYPFKVDTRTEEEKIIADIQFYMRIFSYDQCGQSQDAVTLEKLQLAMLRHYLELDSLRYFLTLDGWTLEERDGEEVVLVRPEPSWPDEQEGVGMWGQDNYERPLPDDTWKSRDSSYSGSESPGDTTRFRGMAEDSNFFAECEPWELEDEPSLILPWEVLLQDEEKEEEQGVEEGVGNLSYENCPQFASSPQLDSPSAETSSPRPVRPRKRLQDQVELDQPLKKWSSQEPMGKLSSGSSLASEPATTRTSPEVMDSGYPYSQDLTPEGEEDTSVGMASDSEPMSPGRAGAGVGGGFLEAAAELVENGDLANNNRDREGNNVIARDEEGEEEEEEEEDDEEHLRDQDRPEDLQPLLDDLENENDVYVALQNGFPAWLLRIENPGEGEAGEGGVEEVVPPVGEMEVALDRAAGEDPRQDD